MLPRFYPRKNRSFRQAINYVLREQVNHGFVITHNLDGNSPEEWHRAFQKNENSRRKQSERKNAVRLRHIVLPWSSKDEVTSEAMEDMTRQFMNLYNPHAVYLAVAHEPDQDHEHPHVHIIAGGTDKFGRAMHLTNKDLLELKQKAEAYQREQYPQYVHSQIEHGKNDRSRSKSRDYWPKKRGESYKEKLQNLLEKSLNKANSEKEFLEILGSIRLTPYYRRGKASGVIFQNRKHRFSSLGISREMIMALEQERSFRERI
ncbi:MAG: relaxase/mobilization nuclease domain-containing protein [Bacteroidia bacterium]